MTMLAPETVWGYIKSVIDEEPASSHLLVRLNAYLFERAHTRPQLKCHLQGGELLFGNGRLDLRRKPLVLRLFRQFLGGEPLHLSKRELIHRIYLAEQDSSGQLSYRIMESHERNILKLLSRARHLARANFDRDGGVHLDWFAYDSFTKSYHLCRLRGAPAVWGDEALSWQETFAELPGR